MFPENAPENHPNSPYQRGQLDIDGFLDSIEVSASSDFVRSLRSTQLWQQFQETWENGIVNPDMTLFRRYSTLRKR